MITNFEIITSNLTEHEIRLTGFVLNEITSKPITTPQIIRKIKRLGVLGSYNLTPPRVRKMINYLRRNGAAIIGTSKGYYVSIDKTELRKQIISLSERMAAIETAKNGLIDTYKDLFDDEFFNPPTWTHTVNGEIQERVLEYIRGMEFVTFREIRMFAGWIKQIYEHSHKSSNVIFTENEVTFTGFSRAISMNNYKIVGALLDNPTVQKFIKKYTDNILILR